MPPRMKQQHLDLGDILGIGKTKKRKEEDRSDAAPKVTAEKMEKFVVAMTDLVKVDLPSYYYTHSLDFRQYTYSDKRSYSQYKDVIVKFILQHIQNSQICSF